MTNDPTETLEPWLPLEGMEEELFLETLRCDHGKLRVTLSRGKDADRTLTIDFGEPQAFRAQPQHALLTEPWWGKLPPASVYVVNHSRYRAWLVDSSAGIIDQPMTHYCIISTDGALDVLTTSRPVATWSNPATLASVPPNFPGRQ